MARKIRVGILCGGKSAEHEVSLRSALNVFEAIDKEKYDVTLIGIDKSGRWLLIDPDKFIAAGGQQYILASETMRGVALVPADNHTALIALDSNSKTQEPLDVVFPILHGPFGEDGTVQGLLKLAGIPFVGAGVLGSAVGMDKDVMKRLLREAGVPIAKFFTFNRPDKIDFQSIINELGLPFFVKPANLGSSVGISKVKVDDQIEFSRVINEAFSYDTKILIEEFIEGREIECSVLGNDHPIASVPGEIIPKHEFYTYAAKYLDPDGAAREIPAMLSEDVVNKVQQLSIRAFKVLCCEGMARVDFFLKSDGSVILNEINTIPGFTNISMYPKLWEASGISYTELIDRLIQLAIERFEKEQKLETSFAS